MVVFIPGNAPNMDFLFGIAGILIVFFVLKNKAKSRSSVTDSSGRVSISFISIAAAVIFTPKD